VKREENTANWEEKLSKWEEISVKWRKVSELERKFAKQRVETAATNYSLNALTLLILLKKGQLFYFR